MNKQQFLEEIRKKLNNLPENDINKSLDYYEEMIQDRMEEGLSEEEAVEALGSMEDIVSQILSEASPQESEKTEEKPSKEMPSKKFEAWQIVLIILGFPLWFPLIIAAFSLILSFYIVIWSVLFSLYSTDFALGVSAIGSIAAAFIQLSASEYAQAVLFFSSFLICGGLSILMFFALLELSKGILFVSKKVIKLCFSRKDKAK